MSPKTKHDIGIQESSARKRFTRREFLLTVTGSAVAAAVASCAPRSYIQPTAYAPGSAPHPTMTPLPTADTNQAAIFDPNYGQLSYDKVFYTPDNKLYITQYDYNNTPEVNGDNWILNITGLVENKFSLNYKEMQALIVFEDDRVLECISNPPGGSLIGNLQMKGFRFSDILSKAKVKPEATHVKISAADGYATALELKWVQHPDTLMAYEINGAPLSVKHGFPVRIMVPGLYGQKMPRWITEIEFINDDYHGYWESRGWSNIASVRTMSSVRSPGDGATVNAGQQLYIQGVAYAGLRKITDVAVQIDNGPWMPATLVPGKSSLAWTQWYLKYNFAAPGNYQIGVRATDDTGMVQNQEGSGTFGNAFPDGTAAIGRVSVQAV